MLALVAGIDMLKATSQIKDVEGRNKSGHDEADWSRFTPVGIIRRLLFVRESDFNVPNCTLFEGSRLQLQILKFNRSV